MGQYQTIEEFCIGERVYGHFLIAKVECRQMNDKKSEFLTLTLLDRTGRIEAKQWQCTDFQKETFVKNKIVYATGTVKDYKGSIDLNLEHIEIAQSTLNPKDFVPCAPFPSEEMLAFVTDKARAIQNEDIQHIVLWVLANAGEKLLSYPAAKGIHHAIYGGLLYHIMTMLQTVDSLVAVHPWLNTDLLYAGVILHDIEKVSEVEAENGIVSERTLAGELLGGHIIQGVILIDRAVRELSIDNEKVKLVLQHIILSHHDRPEWGSPVAPMLPEALMLHMIDNIDAKMYSLCDALSKRKAGEAFTDPIRSLDGRRMYVFES